MKGPKSVPFAGSVPVDGTPPRLDPPRPRDTVMSSWTLTVRGSWARTPDHQCPFFVKLSCQYLAPDFRLRPVTDPKRIGCLRI